MYIVLNQGAGMSTGKAAAQAAHAAVEGYRLSVESDPRNPGQFQESNLIRQWYKGGHYTKIVLSARDAADLAAKFEYIGARDFKCSMIIDEGRTEVEPFTPTAIAVEIVDKDNPHVQATFSSFSLYKDPEPEQEAPSMWRRPWRHFPNGRIDKARKELKKRK
jgi:peptidyl-tRNA hydrolase